MVVGSWIKFSLSLGDEYEILDSIIENWIDKKIQFGFVFMDHLVGEVEDMLRNVNGLFFGNEE
ncbi:hypothetical protein A8709_00135 [Paenibacillus pectinilyticus]|uniref:Uncharacterized protein n=1 Tax=Paenibacillus pectinilyticus TaxID=512399 RepID=A0A1C1A0S9_9BACL|nr:hypothetical protein A8709_00135 [Paenibacillus pectinilyticus]